MATSNAELQAEIDRIMRMAVRLEPVDLRYDVNKDGRVSSLDAYLVNSGAATIPPPPAPAPVVQQPWWVGQFASEADANFVDTNRNQQIEETERATWRSQYDPNSTEYKQRVSQEQEAARQEAARQEAARQAALEQERLIQQQLLNQNTRSAAAAVGVNLPQNWFDLNSKQKADWFVANKITEDQLTRAGVPASDLQALKDVGYYDVPAKEAAERLAVTTTQPPTIPPVTTTQPPTIPPVTTTPPTTTATVTTTAPDAYQKQLDADALARGRERYVLEAEKILGRKLTPEEATALGQAAYPEIQRYTDPKTGAKSYMTPYYDVGSYFRDKLTDEDKQRLDRLIDSSVINAAQKKFPNLPLGIEEQERLKGLYGYEDALTYGGVGMPLDSQGNPKFISELSESDLYNVIVSEVTARQAAENQAAADRAVYDAASQEGRVYNNQIYPTREAAVQASYNDALSQGRVYNNKVYTTKALADLAKSFDQANIAAEQEREQIRLADELYQQNYQNELKAYAEGRVYNNKIYATQQEAQSAKKNDYVLQQANFIQKQIGRDLSQQDIENLTKVVDKYVQDGEEPLNSYTNLIFQDFATQFGSNQDKQKYDEFRDNFIIERIKSQLKRELSPTEISQAKAQDLDIGNFANISNYATSASELETLRQAALQGGNIFGVTGQNLSDVVPIYSGLNQYDPNSGKSVIEYLLESNPKIRQSTEGYSSTFVKTLKNVNGQLVEVDPKGVSQQDLKSGNVYFSIAADDPTDPDYTRRVAYYQAKGDILQPLKNPEDSSPLGGTFFGEQPKTLRDQFFEALPGIMAIGFSAIPGLGQALGASMLPAGVSAATAQAFGSAVINAGMQVAQGVPIEKAILNSAASFGVSQFVPNISGNVYIDNAVRSVATATLTGGDVGKALANSLISTGGNEFFKDASFTGDKVVDSAIASAITSGVQAAATDGDVGASIIRGGIAGGSSELSKQTASSESAKSGAGFIGEDVTEPTSVAESGIDPRILAQGVTGGQFGEGGLLQTGAQVPLDVLQDLMKLRPELVSIIDSGNYYLKVPTADGAYTAYEISPSGQVLNAQPGLSVGETYDPSKTASALEDIIKIEEGKSSPQAVPEGSGLSGSVQPKATDLSPAAQETLLQIGGVLGLGEQDPDAVYEALIGGASGGIGDVALLGYDQLAKLQDEIELIFDEPNLPADAKSEMARIYAEVTNQKRIQEEAIRDQLLNDQQPIEQQVADTGLTVVGQPVNQTPVVSPTTPSVTPPTIAPVVTEPVVTQPSVTQPVVSEPVAQQPTTPDIVTTTPSITQPAQKTELQSEIDRIMRMAVGQETTDLRYDVNKDGRVNSRDAYLVNAGQATIPTAEQYAAQQSASSSTVPSTTPQVTQPVDQTPATTAPSTGPATSTGIVLQNNGDGTALVLTNDGNATNVPATDARSNEPLTPGSSVTIDQNTNTATATPPASDGGAQAPTVSAPPTVQDTGSQQLLGGGQQPTTDAGSIIDTPIGPDTSTPTVPEPVVQEPVVQEPPPPPPPPPAVPTTPEEPITEPPQEPVVDKTEEDLLLEQIIRELEPTPPVSEGVPIPEPVFPEPPLVLPESPTINVGDRLTVRPVVDRGYRRPSVSPGSRVEESAQILPLRPGLSEGGTGGIEGTTEQEQEPVWNVRSLKLRRLLGI